MSFDFTIEVHNKFSAELQKAQQEIESVRQSFTTLKTEMQNMGSATKGLKDAAKEMRALGNQRNTRAFGRANVNLSALGTTMRRLGNQAQGLIDVATGINAIKVSSRGLSSRSFTSFANGMIRLNQSIQALDITQAVNKLRVLAAAVHRLNRAITDAAPILRGYATALGTTSRALSRLPAQLQATTGAIRGQQLAAHEAESAFGGLGASFQRLLVAFVAFKAFNTLTEGFKRLVTTGIEFNATLEQSELSLAALINQNFEVLDSQGRLVKGAEAFAEAQKIARDQVARLRVDALETTATFRELLLAVTAGFGATGQGSGLDANKARKVAVLLSKAATTLQISGDQFAEEIRSALTGTVEQRTTRLAQVTGLSTQEFNRRIRQARELGKLDQEIEELFGSFALLSDKVADTFVGRLARVKEAIEAVVAAGALPFFEALKSLFLEIANQLVTLDPALETLTPKPEAVEAFRGISDGMASVVKEAERLVRDIRKEDIAAIGEALAESFRLAAAVAGPAIEDMIKGLNALSRIATKVFQQFRADADDASGGGVLTKFLNLFDVFESLRNVLSTMDRLVTVVQEKIADLVSAFADLLQGVIGFADTLDFMSGRALTTSFRLKVLVSDLRRLAEVIRNSAGGTVPGLGEDKSGKNLGSTRARPAEDRDLGVLKARVDLALVEARAIQEVNKLRVQTVEIERELLSGALINRRELEIAKANEALQIAKGEIQILKARNALEEEGLRIKLAEARGAEELLLQAELEATRQRNDANVSQAQSNLVVLEAEVARLNAEAERPISFGFQVALQNLDLDPFTEVVNFIEGAVRGLAATISEALLDAFLDPTKDIREAFSSLFKSLAQQLLQLIIQAALVRTLSAVGGAFGVGPIGLAQGGQVPGFAAGGPVPGGSHAEIPGISKLVKGIRGFASGGVAPSDTVPAMLTPGEWVIRLASVRKAGPGVMAAINEGRFDPQALAAAVGTSRSFRRHRGIGYASGGQVRPAGGSFSPAVLIANDQTAERLMAGGRRGVMSFLRANASEINAILGARRG